MPSLISRSLSAAALSFVMAASASATTYNLTGFPFGYFGATGASGQLTTNATGTFVGAAAVEGVFNGSSYSADLYNGASVLAHLDNSNSSWNVSLSAYGNPSVRLTVDPSRMVLSFDTSVDFSGAALIARSSNYSTVLQYRQEHNIFDSTFADFSFNAMNSARSNLVFGQSFIFSAAPVPEPSEVALLSVGLVGLAGLMRMKKSRKAL